MPPTTFATALNNISTKLGAAYNAGSGILTVLPGEGTKFPILLSPHFYVATVIHAAVAYLPSALPSDFTVFKVTGISGDTLQIAGTLDGTVDRNYVAGDVVELRVAATLLTTLQTAVNALETSPSTVASVFARTGAVTAQAGDYAVDQITGAAPLASPTFTGNPRAPTPATADSSTSLATTAFVKNQGYSSGAGAGSVTSVGLSMPVEFTVGGSPVTTAGTLAVTKNTQSANLVYAAPSVVSGAPSFRNLTSLDIPNSVVLTGTPQAPTPTTGDNSTTLATTAFVKNQGYSVNTGTVSSVGLVAPAEFTVAGSPVTAAGTLTLAKATQTAGMFYAGPATGPAVVPTFRSIVSTDIPPSVVLTGTPTSPTPATADSTAAIATTAFVKAQNYITAVSAPVASVFGRTGAVVAAPGDYAVGQIAGAAPLASPALTGNPTAPTVASADSSTNIATTGFVKAQNYLTAAPVASVFGRIGTVVASTGDYGVAQVTGAAPLASPGLTGVPTAPTAAPGTNTTQIASTAFVLANVGGGAVSSVFGRVGAIVQNTGDYSVGQVTGTAPLASPAFTGTPTAPTPLLADNDTSIATTAFVKGQNYLTSAPVTSVFSRTGVVTAQSGDYSVGQITGAAPTASPTFSGVPTAPTATTGTSTTQLATTAFVMANQATPAVSSVFGRTGAIVQVSGDYTVSQVTGAAPLASPTFTGTPAAPTATVGTNTTQLATCAFVLANAGGGAVSSVFGRTGVVVATSGDYGVAQVTGAAPLASPTFTGVPLSTTPATADNTTKIATTAFVKAQGYMTVDAVPSVFGRTGAVVATTGDYAVAQVTGAAPLASPTFTGVPAAPTATVGTNTTQLATCAFVLANAPGGSGVTTVFGRSGTVVATAGDYTVGQVTGAAPLASPALTGTPTAPTATVGTNNTQVATTAFVLANQAAGGVTSVFTRTGAIVAASGDYTVGQVTGAAPLASPSLTGTPTAPTATAGTNTTQLATTAFVVANALVNPNPSLWGTTTFKNLAGTVSNSHIDATTGNFCTDRVDAASLFVGLNAGKVATGTNNVYIGYNAASVATSGANNVVIGTSSLQNATSGVNSTTAVGYNTLLSLTATSGGSLNTAVGVSALSTMTAGSGNTAIGATAGNINATGSNNTYLGYNAGSSGTGSLSTSTAIGYNAQITASNQIMLGTATETTSIPGALAVTGAATFGTIPTAPTAATSDNSTKLATTTFVQVLANNLAKATVNGRLTAVTGSPLGTGQGTTLYFTPYRGAQIGLYDGTANWNLFSYGPSDLSVAVPATTGLYDVFAYNNAGTLALEFSNAWSNSGYGTATNGTRTDALAIQDGIYVKSANTTRRYLGTIWSQSGTVHDVNQFRRIWNYYNQTLKNLKVIEIATSWVWNGLYRALNGNANGLSYMDVVVGIFGNQVAITYGMYAVVGSGSTYAQTGIGYDQSTSGNQDYNMQILGVGAGMITALNHQTHIGRHAYWLLEWTNNQAVTFYGVNYQGVGSQFVC